MGTLLRGLGYALGKFRAARAFTVTAVLTLAVGIGGTTAIFTLIHAVMLKSLPVGDPTRLGTKLPHPGPGGHSDQVRRADAGGARPSRL